MKTLSVALMAMLSLGAPAATLPSFTVKVHDQTLQKKVNLKSLKIWIFKDAGLLSCDRVIAENIDRAKPIIIKVSSRNENTFEFNVPETKIDSEENCIAVAVQNEGFRSKDLFFDVDLTGFKTIDAVIKHVQNLQIYNYYQNKFSGSFEVKTKDGRNFDDYIQEKAWMALHRYGMAQINQLTRENTSIEWSIRTKFQTGMEKGVLAYTTFEDTKDKVQLENKSSYSINYDIFKNKSYQQMLKAHPFFYTVHKMNPEIITFQKFVMTFIWIAKKGNQTILSGNLDWPQETISNANDGVDIMKWSKVDMKEFYDINWVLGITLKTEHRINVIELEDNKEVAFLRNRSTTETFYYCKFTCKNEKGEALKNPLDALLKGSLGNLYPEILPAGKGFGNYNIIAWCENLENSGCKGINNKTGKDEDGVLKYKDYSLDHYAFGFAGKLTPGLPLWFKYFAND